MLELPLFSIGGFSPPQTMKLLGKIASAEVVVMIESGARHNFVSRALVDKVGMKVDELVKFGVFLGDRCKVACQGVCSHLGINLGTCKLNIVGYLFELGDVDVITWSGLVENIG